MVSKGSRRFEARPRRVGKWPDAESLTDWICPAAGSAADTSASFRALALPAVCDTHRPLGRGAGLRRGCLGTLGPSICIRSVGKGARPGLASRGTDIPSNTTLLLVGGATSPTNPAAPWEGGGARNRPRLAASSELASVIGRSALTPAAPTTAQRHTERGHHRLARRVDGPTTSTRGGRHSDVSRLSSFLTSDMHAGRRSRSRVGWTLETPRRHAPSCLQAPAEVLAGYYEYALVPHGIGEGGAGWTAQCTCSLPRRRLVAVGDLEVGPRVTHSCGRRGRCGRWLRRCCLLAAPPPRRSMTVSPHSWATSLDTR